MCRFFVFLLLFTASMPLCGGEPDFVRLRWTWGGSPAAWFGECSVNSGKLTDWRPLMVDTDLSAGTRLENGRILVRQAVPKGFNGCDFVVPYRSDAVIRIQLANVSEYRSAKVYDIPIREILQKSKTLELENGGRLLLKRVPGDELRVTPENSQLVFSPGDVFRASVCPALGDGATGTATLQVQLFRGRETFEIFPDDTLQEKKLRFDLKNPTPLSVERALPEEEGVYDLVFSLRTERSGKIMEPIIRPFSGSRRDSSLVSERRVQLVVVDSARKTERIGTSEETLVLEIDPSQPRWWEALQQASSFQFLRWNRGNRETIGSGNSQTATFSMGQAVELPPGDQEETSWEAYPLSVEKMGTPHFLEVEYPDSTELSLGISILEPNAAGAVLPVGIDSGVTQPANPLENTPSPKVWKKHRILFWPKSKTPIILMTNRHAKKSAYYGKIRILSLDGLKPMFTDAQKQERIGGRRVAALFTRPLFPECFSATEMAGAIADFSMDDWTTFYDGASRLLEYLNYAGYNSVVMAAYAEGSTIYPSERLAPTPRYDSGTFLSSGQDPVRKDVLEMMFRMFNREQMTFFPAMDFTSPIPELEQLAQANPGLRWRDATGQNYTDTLPTLREGAPYYNILNSQVQNTVLQCVDEMISRYSHHASFGGVAILLHERSFLVLPPPRWGVDPDTLRQFAQETNLTLPNEYSRQVRYVLGEGLQPWLAWRASRLTLFYKHLASRLSGSPQAKLYLVGTDYLTTETHPELGARLAGSLTAEEVLLRSGIDIRQLVGTTNIVFPRPQRILPNVPLAETLPDLQWGQTPGTYRAFQSQPVPSCTYYHPPQTLRLEAFDAKSPFKPTYTWLASTLTQSGTANRRRFAESLAMMDADMVIDGGWMPCLGQEESVRETFRVLRQLPSGRFNSAMMSDPSDRRVQPIIFRSFSENGENFVYAVNLSPFPMEGQVYLQASGRGLTTGTALQLSNDQIITFGKDARGVFWQRTLQPYQIEAIRFPGDPVMLLDPVANFSGDVQLAFRKQFRVLQERLGALRSPTLYMGLDNANFENVSTGVGVIPGWETLLSPPTENVATAPVVELDRNMAQSGTASLHLRTAMAPARVMSHPFVSNPTGRIAVAVWMKTNASTPPPVRFVLEGTLQGRKFYRTASLTHSPQKISAQWTPLSINVTDLPLAENMELRIGFELSGPGEVWIDNIQLSDMNFTPAEQQTLARMFSTFQSRIQRGDVVPCVSILESFWMRFLKENITTRVVPLPSEQTPSVAAIPPSPPTGSQPPLATEKVSLPPPPVTKPVSQVSDAPHEIPKKKSAIQKMKDWLPW